jgi:hypothetical protein
MAVIMAITCRMSVTWLLQGEFLGESLVRDLKVGTALVERYVPETVATVNVEVPVLPA